MALMTDPRKRKPAKGAKPPKAPAKGAAGKGAPASEWRRRLKALREKHGLTQSQAAERIATTLTTWQGWEYGSRQPSPMVQLLIKLAIGPIPD